MNFKKSIGIINPHTTMFGYPLSWRIQRHPHVAKAKPLLNILEKQFDINLLSDGTETSFSIARKTGLTKYISPFELAKWREVEGLFGARLVKSYQESDVNLVSWWNIGGGCKLLANMQFSNKFINGNYKKVLYLNHPHEYMEIFTEVIEGFDFIVSEIIPNKKIQEIMNIGEDKLLNIPYFVSDRFKNEIDIEERLDQLIIIGSIHRLRDEAAFKQYKKIFQKEYLHSERINIISKKHDPRFVNIKMLVEKNDEKYLEIDPYKQGISTRDYFNFDMNKAFNSYKLFNVSGEDLGVPPISFFEGVKAGAIYFGVNSDWVEFLGLKQGLDYIRWSGNFDTLNDEINWAVKNYDLKLVSSSCSSKLENYYNEKINSIIKKI